MNSPFPDYVALLGRFLERHREICAEIEGRLLNVQGKPITRTRDRTAFQQALNDSFFEPGLPVSLASLKGRLAAAHIADGFEPVLLQGRSHQLDPLELVVRAYVHWEHHRWPGKNGRLTYAQILFAAFVLCELEHLSLRIWDDGDECAAEHLDAIQDLLNRLNQVSGSGVFVRDARWLIQTAQGPLTRRLEPYFKVADRVARSLTAADRLELHKAGARLAGGHLRSQLRYRSMEMGCAIDAPQLLAVTRNSNSMDAALLVYDLVALLEAYSAARIHSDMDARRDLADAILQGLSADPDLFLVRLDVLAPGTMLEDVFVERTPDGSPAYTALGRAHVDALSRYSDLIGDLARDLRADASGWDPARAIYSPFGITYGFCADVLSNMALDTLRSQPSFELSLEDMFCSAARLEDKRARAQGWEALPQQPGEREHFGHSIDWAAAIFGRVMSGLAAREVHASAPNASALRSGRLVAFPKSQASASSALPRVPDDVQAQDHVVTSDLKLAVANGATAFPKSQILSDRKEGRYLASAESNGHWFGVSKSILTISLCQGKDAWITDVPASVLDVLRLTCGDLLDVLLPDRIGGG